MTSVTPMTELVYEWDTPASDGCLPILSYTLWKDGVLKTNIDPSLTSFTDNITVGGLIG